MSDRRAVSAGHLGASSVAAANETWRVAVGGNRVENMTVDQIAQAFQNGQLNVRTPLWPPGTTGWQALGNFEQFQIQAANYGSGGYGNAGYDNGGYDGRLSQFEEADDDPTRMWTGSADDLSGLDGMQPPPAPMQQRPSARTGTRQVSRPAPSHAIAAPPPPPPAPARPMASQPAAAPTRSLPPAPSVASRTPALVPPFRQSRGNGLMLVAGLVGLVGLGSAVLAARGNWSASAEPPPSVELAAEAAVSEPPVAETPAAEVAKTEAPKADAPKSQAGEAQLAKYDVAASTASAFVAGESVKPAGKAEARADEPKATTKREKSRDDEVSSAAKPEKSAKSSRNRSAERAAKKLSSRATPKRAAIAALPRQKPQPAPPPRVEKVVDKPEKIEKAEKAESAEAQLPPASSAVNESAATALANSANLASSCRPRGGPAGPGKARVIYSNDGEVQSVEILTAKFRDTLTGSCVRMVFRRAKIPAFKGEPPTFIKSFTIPEE